MSVSGKVSLDQVFIADAGSVLLVPVIGDLRLASGTWSELVSTYKLLGIYIGTPVTL